MKIIQKNKVIVSIIRNWVNQEVELNISIMTRWIKKQINEITFGNKEIQAGDKVSVSFSKMQQSQDVTIKLLCWLSDEDISNMDDKDFDALSLYINDWTIPLTKTTWPDWVSSEMKESNVSWWIDGVLPDEGNETN